MASARSPDVLNSPTCSSTIFYPTIVHPSYKTTNPSCSSTNLIQKPHLNPKPKAGSILAKGQNTKKKKSTETIVSCLCYKYSNDKTCIQCTRKSKKETNTLMAREKNGCQYGYERMSAYGEAIY